MALPKYPMNHTFDNHHIPRLGDPMTCTEPTMDIQKVFDAFRKHYGAQVYPGYTYRRIDPIHNWSSSNDILNISTSEEAGFLISVSGTELREVVLDAAQGIEHKQFRERNAAAAELYDQYQMMFALSRQYKE